MAREYEGEVDIVGVSGRDSVSAMEDFEEKYDLPMPSVADTGLEVWSAARVRGQPAWVFIQPDGTAELFYRPSDSTVQEQLDQLAAQ